MSLDLFVPRCSAGTSAAETRDQARIAGECLRSQWQAAAVISGNGSEVEAVEPASRTSNRHRS